MGKHCVCEGVSSLGRTPERPGTTAKNPKRAKVNYACSSSGVEGAESRTHEAPAIKVLRLPPPWFRFLLTLPDFPPLIPA
jgi:hypothetical protein